MYNVHSAPQGPNLPPEKLTPLTENPSPDCNILNPPPRVPSLKVVGNSYYHSPFPNKNMAHLLTHSLPPSHSLTHSLTHLLIYLLAEKGWGKTIIAVVCPKQKIEVFINFYNFSFVLFSISLVNLLHIFQSTFL